MMVKQTIKQKIAKPKVPFCVELMMCYIVVVFFVMCNSLTVVSTKMIVGHCCKMRVICNAT